jgi:hypothetical protein
MTPNLLVLLITISTFEGRRPCWAIPPARAEAVSHLSGGLVCAGNAGGVANSYQSCAL